MADTPQTIALLAFGQLLRGETVRTINRKSSTLRALRIVDGIGQNCAWAVEGDGQVGEEFSEGAAAANFTSDSQTQAVLQWARARSNFKVTGSARRAARSAQAGPGGNKALIARNLVNSSAKVASIMNGRLFNGTGASDMPVGFDAAIGDDANTYATINRATAGNEFWKPTVVDPGSLIAPTFSLMRSDRTKIFKACGEMPDLALVAPEVFDTIGGLYDSTRRYVKDIVTARGKVTLDAGFEALELDGMFFLKDKDATANRIYYVNSNYVEIQVQQPDLDALGDVTMNMAADDGYGAFPLGIQCTKLAKDGDSDKYMCLSEYALVVRRPNTCGVRKNVATS